MRRFPPWLPTGLLMQAVLFGILARRGVSVSLSAMVACTVVVAIRFLQLLLAEEEQKGGVWSRLLDFRSWTPQHRADLKNAGIVAILLTFVLLLAGWATDKL